MDHVDRRLELESVGLPGALCVRLAHPRPELTNLPLRADLARARDQQDSTPVSTPGLTASACCVGEGGHGM